MAAAAAKGDNRETLVRDGAKSGTRPGARFVNLNRVSVYENPPLRIEFPDLNLDSNGPPFSFKLPTDPIVKLFQPSFYSRHYNVRKLYWTLTGRRVIKRITARESTQFPLRSHMSRSDLNRCGDRYFSNYYGGKNTIRILGETRWVSRGCAFISVPRRDGFAIPL